MSLNEQVSNEVKAPEKIRCLVVDDHALVRHGVRRLLEDEPDFEVVAEAGDASEAVQMAQEHWPDIVLMDLGMPGMSPFDATMQIRRDRSDTKVVFLTMHEGREYVIQAIRSGAAGYVLKDTPAPEFVEGLREVQRGGRYLSPEVLDGLPAKLDSGMRLVPTSSTLTPRETEIVKLVAEGNSARRIAELLGLSVKTVEAHKFNLMRKLDIHNKAQLVTYAIRNRIVKVSAGA